MSRRDSDYLLDILEAMSRISSYSEGMTKDSFMNDTKTQDAIVRNIEVIGEATKKLSSDLTEANAEVPWRSMAGMRDKVIHEYFGINYDIVWTVASQELSGLQSVIEQIAADQGSGG